MSTGFVFHRPRLAARLAEAALGLDVLGGTSGLFLAAPRRTGKSTFLKGDLVPELERRGAVPIYVDLWEDRERDPAELIRGAIRTAIRGRDGPVARLARASGVTKVGIGSWLSVDVDRIGAPGGATLTDAMRGLVERTGRPLVLIVDEAQHALTSEAGVTAMFALKSARDVLNLGEGAKGGANVRLGLVFTGSNRDRLASLVVAKNQPFFGSAVTPFPLLGRDYTDAYSAYVNGRLAADRQLEPGDVYEAFRVVAFRPQLLQAAISGYVMGGLGEERPRRARGTGRSSTRNGRRSRRCSRPC